MDETPITNIIPEKKEEEQKNEDDTLIPMENKISKESTNIENEINTTEFFINSPLLLLILKILLFSEGKIMRIFAQIGDLYFCILITNIYVEIVIILLCSSADSTFIIELLGIISSFTFAFLMRNPTTIAFWELAQFKWIRCLNPFETLTDLFNIKFGRAYQKNISYIVHGYFGIFFWLYLIALVTMGNNNGIFLDIVNLNLLVIIPILKFIIYYIAYLIVAVKNFFTQYVKKEKSKKDPFKFWIALSNLTHDESHDLTFHCGESSFQIPILTLIKVFFSLLSYCYIIYLFCKKGFTISGFFLLTIIWLFSTIISIEISTPFWIINKIYRWYLRYKGRLDYEKERQYKELNRHFKGFVYWNILGIALGLIIIIACLFVSLLFREKGFDTASHRFNKKQTFTTATWERESDEEAKKVKSAVCLTSIYEISLLKLSALSQAAYLNDTENMINYYTKTIFSDGNEVIQNMTLLTSKNNDGIILQTDIDIPGNKEVTVFSIRGSRTNLDWWLDVEVFSSSAMFSLLRWIPLISKFESITSKTLSYLLTLPLRTLEQFTLFKKYIDTLSNAIDDQLKEINNTRYIIFTGHSLGGGLAKYMGIKYNMESLSVSGPGISPLEYKFINNKDYNRYFKANFLDIVPDNDLIPRLEVSGGVRYRVICEEGFISCHKIDRTICTMGAMCRQEYLTGDMCMSILGKKNYMEIREATGVKNDIPDIYK